MSKTGELFGTFFKIGAFTFGGGYAMVALLEHEFVEEKRWLTREEFLDMVAIAESTPGPVAVNSATYIGYKLAGVAGAAAFIAIAVPVDHGQTALVILAGYHAAGVHAEGAHLALKGIGIINELRLVKMAG